MSRIHLETYGLSLAVCCADTIGMYRSSELKKLFEEAGVSAKL